MSLRSTLGDIADAIRAKTGKSDTMTPLEMPAEIAAITTGGDLDGFLDGSITHVESDVTAVRGEAMVSCEWLQSVSFPHCTSLGGYALYRSIRLRETYFPALKTIDQCAFQASAITSVDLPCLTSLTYMSFGDCTDLGALIIRNTAAVATMGSNMALSNTKISSGQGYIYVPAALVSQYQAATNWTTYASQIRALEDYTVDGTVTGALDPSKI